ncbi:MAG: hypothetical protein O3C34_07335 [Proteobacteria bacterium]|nr:hypothetical protein [Pseudomonadota bacterium]
MRHKAFIGRIATGIFVAVLLTGCAEVISGDAQRVSISTGFLGEYAPGTREWLSWLQARDHCALHSKSPEIEDLKGSVALYKCVADK